VGGLYYIWKTKLHTMKKTLITMFIVALLAPISGMAQSAPTEPIKKDLAEVPQYSGVYVFLITKPVREYEYIATIKKSVVWKTAQEAIREYAKYAKEQHPNCDAIIFNDLQGGFSKDIFDVVKFK